MIKKHKSKRLPLIIICCFMVLLMVYSTNIFTLPAFADSSMQKIYDDYGLFSEDEESKLNDIFSKYSKKGNIDIVMVTTDNLDDKNIERYMQTFYDSNGFGYDKVHGNAVILLLYMNSHSREVRLQGYKDAEYAIDEDRGNHILDDITPLLSDGEYYKAMTEYAKQASYYMTHRTIFHNTFFQLGISVLIGIIVVAIMAANSGGRVTTHSRTYLDQGNSGVIASRDDYIRTTTTRIKKPSNNNGGGKGGGGVSPGGHSHSSAGRSF